MSGIWSRYLADHAIDADAWRAAVDTRQLVGTCQPCGGQLKPGEPYQTGAATWYPAACVTCSTPVAAPGPRPKAKPKARVQRPVE